MVNRAAIRWVTKGNSQPPVIQYMLLDSHLEYIVYPKECAVENLKEAISNLIDELIAKSGDTPIEIYYKTINVYYGRHRKDSGQFHRLLKKYLAQKKASKNKPPLGFFIKKGAVATV